MNGTLPAAISPKITSQDALDTPGVKVIVQELPRINFIQKCRTILRIIGETLVAYHIGKLESGCALKADTCNWASKMRLNIVEQIHAAAEALRKNDYDVVGSC